jgi:hypothetical protein
MAAHVREGAAVVLDDQTLDVVVKVALLRLGEDRRESQE